MTDIVQLSERLKRSFNAALNERADAAPDTAAACNLLTLVERACTEVAGESPHLSASVSAETPSTATLAIVGLPHASAACCADLELDPLVVGVQFQFDDESTMEPLDGGRLLIQFWRASATPEQRQRVVYTPPPTLRQRTAEPDWDEAPLAIGGERYGVDRSRILDVMHRVYNCERLMPDGIVLRAERTYARDFIGGKRKAPDDDESDPSASEQVPSGTHTGYALYFSGPLPTLTLAFFTHLRKTVGDAVLGCMVLFPRTQATDERGVVARRLPELVIALRSSGAHDETARKYAVAGSRRLAKRIATAKSVSRK